jgi:hypothetical protein
VKQTKTLKQYWIRAGVVTVTVFTLIGVFASGHGQSAPQATTAISTANTEAPTTTTTPTTTSTTTTTEAPLNFDIGDLIDEARNTHGQCGEWYETAMQAGWQPEEWKRLSLIMFRESRCTPDACSKSTSGLKCRDAGLLQVNQIHTKYLADLGLSFPDDMFDPLANLMFARRLYDSSGWNPWKSTSGINN